MSFEDKLLALGLDSEAIAFIQKNMLSYVKSAMLLRFFLENPEEDRTQANFARGMGESEPFIASEIDRLIKAGIVTTNRMEDGTVIYSLTKDQATRKTLDTIVELYEINPTFRRLLATEIAG
jgi:hypothetical protein